MPHVFACDRRDLIAYLDRTGRPVPEVWDHYASPNVWAEFLADRCTFEPIAEAPRDGTAIEVLYDDGTTEQGVYWAEQRQCMLGARGGERGAGWLSREIGLPVGDEPTITHYRML